MSNLHDAGIPLLTEVIVPTVHLPRVDVEDDVMPPVEVTETTTPRPERRVSAQSQEARQRLENALASRILQQLHHEMDQHLEHRVCDAMADVVQAASEGLAKELRLGLLSAMEKIVHEAVKQELARVRGDKPK